MTTREEKHTASAEDKRKEGSHVEKPTTAVADKKTKKMFDALNEVDPARISEVLKNAVTQFNTVQNLLKFGGSSSSGGGQTPNSGLKDLLTDALTGAMCILIKKYGYIRVLEFFSTLLTEQNYNLLLDDYKEIVKNAMIKLYVTVAIYGEKNIPVSIIPPIILGDKVPSNLVTVVPDLYVQQYFTPQNDPYPGYIKWLGPNDETVYTLRLPSEPPFDTSEQHVYSIAEQGLAKELSVYFDNTNLTLTIAIFLNLLIFYCNLMEEKGLESTVGKNSKNSSNLTQLLGSVLGSLTSKAQLGHIPPSVLNKSKMNQVIANQNMMQGRLNSTIKPALKKAVSGSMDNPMGLISGLLGGANLSSLTNQMSNLTRLTGGVDTSVPENSVKTPDQIVSSLYVIDSSNEIKTVINNLSSLV